MGKNELLLICDGIVGYNIENRKGLEIDKKDISLCMDSNVVVRRF